MRRLVALAVAGLGVAVAVSSWLSAPRPAGGAVRPLFEGANIDARVRAIFDRSCADCHSERTVYPWYSYVAPVSFLVGYDVREGRRHLNVSRWSEYSPVRRQRCLSEIANQVRDGEMPPAIYTVIHHDARLPPADADALFHWTQAERMRLITERSRVHDLEPAP